MNWQDRIVVDAKILAGKPVIKGTRLAVEFIVELLANGRTETSIFENYPRLTHEDILAALQYSTTLLSSFPSTSTSDDLFSSRTEYPRA